MAGGISKYNPNQPRRPNQPRPLDGLGRLGDTFNPYRTDIQPNPSAPQPPGPANFPISKSVSTPTTELDALKQLLDVNRQILRELKAQNNSGKVMIRAADVDDTGKTLDWSMVGLMDRFTARNMGPDSVWIGFDINGKSVDAFTSNMSYLLQAQESLSLPHCEFFKIGCLCQSGQTATIHVTAFKAVAGNLGLSIT